MTANGNGCSLGLTKASRFLSKSLNIYSSRDFPFQIYADTVLSAKGKRYFDRAL